jgi:sortase (surface protein transpeptidase)
MTENTTTTPNKVLFKFIIPIGLVLILVAILFALFNPLGKATDGKKTTSSTAASKSYDTNSTEIANQKFTAKPSNKADEKISQTLSANTKLKRINGGEEYNWDMGYQDVEAMRKCETKDFGPTKIPNFKEIGFADVPKDLIRDIVPVPKKIEKKNTISYPEYKVDVPLIYTNIEDMFDKDAEGKIDFNKRVNDDNANSPLQTKLKAGAILLPISPLPGDVGNSYISGHTSNYSFVDSAFNTAFKPLMFNGKVGDTFYIYDCEGRKLPFTVFEAKEYKDDPNVLWANTSKREVTLQGSVLKDVPGRGLMPTHRWIIRGELDLAKAKEINK